MFINSALRQQACTVCSSHVEDFHARLQSPCSRNPTTPGWSSSSSSTSRLRVRASRTPRGQHKPKWQTLVCRASSSGNSEVPDGWQQHRNDINELSEQEQPSISSRADNDASSSSTSSAHDTHASPQVEEQQYEQQQQEQVPEEQGQQQQQQQQHSLSPEQLQMQYLRHQAAKLQALEQYQELMAHYPSSSSGSSSSGSSSSAKRRARSGSSSKAAGGAEGQAEQHEVDDVPLLEAALLIAKHAHPDLDANTVKQQLDDLAREVEQSLPEDVRYPLRVIKEINRVLYDVHGFRGNMEDYYHPDNSCINRVLETKRGIPISLSLVYMEVASRLGLTMAGVNLPAHFMIRPQVDGMEVMIDAFNKGELTALQDAEAVLGRLMGAQVKLDPRFVRGDTPYFSHRQLLLRLLNNLRQTYMTLNMAEEALSIVRYMRATAPAGSLPELQRDEGMCLYGLGRLPEAADVLSDYMKHASDGTDAAIITAILERIREKAAEAAAAAAIAAAAGSSSSSDVEDSGR